MKPRNNSVFVVVSNKNSSTEFKFYKKKPLFVSPNKLNGYLDLTPINLPVNLKTAPTAGKRPFCLQCAVTVKISTESELLPVAAEKLFGLKSVQIAELASDTVLNYTRLAVAQFYVEEIDIQKGLFFPILAYEVEEGLNFIGMETVEFCFTDGNGKPISFGREKILNAVDRAKEEIERQKKLNSP